MAKYGYLLGNTNKMYTTIVYIFNDWQLALIYYYTIRCR